MTEAVADPLVETLLPCIRIHDTEEYIPICEGFLHNSCPDGENCNLNHYILPYLWQIHIESEGWRSLLEESQDIEKAFCSLLRSHQMQTYATLPDRGTFPLSLIFDFLTFQVQMSSPFGFGVVPVRRVSTSSYAERWKHFTSEDSAPYLTQWRWYWVSETCKMFNHDGKTPPQHIIESKFLSQQAVYRFVAHVEGPGGSNNRSQDLECLLNYQQMELTCLNDRKTWTVLRRPLFISHDDILQGKSLENPEMHQCPYVEELPEGWTPIDTTQPYELVPLLPDSLAFHLVASEFNSSPGQRRIVDVFRVQNPFLWQQYTLKKKWMERSHAGNSPEQFLFHGTNEEPVVQAICRDNFDWRVNNKNDTVYGKGSYFAKNAAYSDKFSRLGNEGNKWMFMARVLVGRYTKGSREFVRPPPRDSSKPNGVLYDSCVDRYSKPSIFVIFNSDQCYPEYLICYE